MVSPWTIDWPTTISSVLLNNAKGRKNVDRDKSGDHKRLFHSVIRIDLDIIDWLKETPAAQHAATPISEIISSVSAFRLISLSLCHCFSTLVIGQISSEQSRKIWLMSPWVWAGTLFIAPCTLEKHSLLSALNSPK